MSMTAEVQGTRREASRWEGRRASERLPSGAIKWLSFQVITRKIGERLGGNRTMEVPGTACPLGRASSLNTSRNFIPGYYHSVPTGRTFEASSQDNGLGAVSRSPCESFLCSGDLLPRIEPSKAAFLPIFC